MTHLYLIRHGRTDWNDADRLQGWADEPLNAAGRAQAAALAARLGPLVLDALYASPLRRARETAEAVAAARASSQALAVRLDDRLRERNVGEWTGLTLDQARARLPARFVGDWRVAGAPGGETQAALTARVAAALDDIVAAYPTGTVAVVSHGGALSGAITHLLGIPVDRQISFSFHNTAIARVNLQPNGAGGNIVRLISLGDDRHLDRMPPAAPDV